MSDLGAITPCYSVTFQRHVNHTPERLWRAITDSSEVSRWMDYPTRIEPHRGGDYYVDFSRTDGGELDGVIVRVEPERELAYAWGTSVVYWSLTPVADGCDYTFGQTGLAFRPIDAEEGLAAGWHVWLDMLDAYLDGTSSSREEQDSAWLALMPPYRERLSAIQN